MGWGSAIADAFEAATDAAKAAAQTAAATAQTAWDFTRQKASQTYDALAQGASAAADRTQEAAQSAQQWTADAAAAVKDNAVAAKQWTEQKAASANSAVGQAFDNIDKAFTQQPAGAPIKSCPLANADAPLPPPRGGGTCKPPPPCFVKPLSVKCGHGDRGFVLIPPNTPTNATFDQVIQLIAEKNEVDQIAIDFAAGSCPFGAGPVWPCVTFHAIDSKGPLGMALHGPPSPLMPMQSGDMAGKLIPFQEFFRYFIGPWGNVDYISYPGSVQCCQGGRDQSFEVQVFPYRKWNGEISAGIEFAGPRTKLAVKGELAGTYGVRTVKVSLPSPEIGVHDAVDVIPGSQIAFGGTKLFLDKVLPSIRQFTEGRYVTIKPEWPNLKFGGQAETAEVKGKYDVAWKGDVSLALSPLIGVSGTFDALQWLIDVACFTYLQPPPFAKFVSDQIRYLRKKAEEGDGGQHIGGKFVARVDIIAKGSVGGTLKWEFLPQQNDKASGQLSADLDLSVSGKISGEARAWKVSYQAGASIVGESGVAGKVDACFYGGDPAWDGYFEFKGLTIKAMAFQSFGGSSVGSNPEGQAAIADRKTAAKDKKWWQFFDTNDEELRTEDSANWEMEIIAKGTWGKEGEGQGGTEDEIVGRGGSFGGGGSQAGYTTLATGM